MKALLFLCLSVMAVVFLPGERIAVFEQPVDPNELVVSNQWIYVADFPHVYIYSAVDYNLKKTLGGE